VPTKREGRKEGRRERKRRKKLVLFSASCNCYLVDDSRNSEP
jgi:hypothetical protein